MSGNIFFISALMRVTRTGACVFAQSSCPPFIFIKVTSFAKGKYFLY